MRRLAKWLLGLLVVLVVLLGALVWLASRTETSVWLLERLAQTMGASLELKGARGTLLGRIEFGSVMFDAAELRVAATDARLAWASIEALIRERRITVHEIVAAELVIENKVQAAGGPPVPPDSIALPLALEVERLAIDRLVIVQPGGRTEVRNLAARLSAGPDAARLVLESISTPFGDAEGRLSMGAHAPFALDGTLVIENRAVEYPFRAELSIAGELALIGIGGFARLDIGTARGAVVVTPFGATLVERIEASTEDFDLTKLRPDLPRARLDVSISGGLRGDDRFVGHLSVINRTPGAVDRSQIPLARLDTDVDATADEVLLQALTANLGQGGEVRGSGRFRDGTLELDLSTGNLNLAGIASQLEPTRLKGDVALAAGADVQRARGNLADQRIAAEFDVERSGDRLDVRALALRAGRGRVNATGQLDLGPEGRFEAKGTIRDFDPTVLAAAAPPALVNAQFDAAGRIRPDPQGTIRFSLRESRFRGLPAEGSGTVEIAGERLPVVDVDLLLAGNRLTAKGALGAPADELRWRVDAERLQQLGFGLAGRLRANGVATGGWQALRSDFSGSAEGLRLPGEVAIGALTAEGKYAPDEAEVQLAARGLGYAGVTVAELAASGKYRLTGKVAIGSTSAKGTFVPDEAEVKVTARDLKRADVTVAEFSASGTYARGSANAELQAHNLKSGDLGIATLDVKGDGSREQHRIDVKATGGQLEFGARLAGALGDDRVWRGTLERFASSGALAAELKGPARLEAGAEQVRIDGATIALFGGEARIDSVVLAGERIRTVGRFERIALRDIARERLAVLAELELAGEWTIDAGDTLNGRVLVRRTSGELSVPDGGKGIAVGLRQLEADLRAERNRLTGTLTVNGERIGSARATVTTVATRRDGVWGVPGDAALGGDGRFDIASIAWLSALTRGTASFDGAVRGDLRLSGTVSQPRPIGTLRGEGLRVTLPEDGLVLTKGVAELVFDERTATLKEALFYGDVGTVRGSGSMRIGPPLEGELQLEFARLDALTDPARAVKVSGDLIAKLSGPSLKVTGKLRADEGRLRLPDADTPRLGGDVVVLTRKGEADKPDPGEDQAGRTRVSADVEFDLGDRFQLTGRGIDTRLSGRIRIRATEAGFVRIFGSVRVESGTVRAYGQELVIERGTVTFNGPLDNPQLNLIAVRPNLPVRVGVQVTGFALEPRAVLFSDPTMRNSDRLAWLVLGRSAEGLSPTDLTLLSTAATALMSSDDSAPLQTRIAGALGLDELAVRATGSAETAVVAVGKRLSDKLFLTVERNLVGLGTVLALRYQFNRNWSLQGQTGTRSTIDLFYTLSFD